MRFACVWAYKPTAQVGWDLICMAILMSINPISFCYRQHRDGSHRPVFKYHQVACHRNHCILALYGSFMRINWTDVSNIVLYNYIGSHINIRSNIILRNLNMFIMLALFVNKYRNSYHTDTPYRHENSIYMYVSFRYVIHADNLTFLSFFFPSLYP